MATTVQISESTKQMLERIKEKENRATYNDVIEELAKKELDVPESLFGKVKISPFTRKDRLKFREL